ncbi:MAG: NAD(P)/FAD-dependent oxidoreductase [Phycisphaerales bacterium]
MSGSNGSAGYDVAILGGGPAGTTVGSLLKKYGPELRVLILEKEKFPREHVGESQLPACSWVLDEMGVWEKVEAAGFPIKLGASYTWGVHRARWDLDFYPAEKFRDEPRPAKFVGQRRATAFQVERAIYDDILLRHAAGMGCEVREETRVTEITRDGDRVTGLRLDSGETVTARHYVDTTGAVGLLRRAMGVETDAPMTLRNIAVWNYWENAEWAIEIGVGGTRVQVRSLPYGWIWFIPLGPTRTSIGLICPSEYYKASGKSPAELYEQAVRADPDIAKLIVNARPVEQVRSCKDWSHLADRVVGENWVLAGESAGFADPILAAGLTLAHSSARATAYMILELERGEQDAAWLRSQYDEATRMNIRQHIRFAEFWYSANGQFTDIQEHCQKIAKECGLKMNPGQAWRWLSQGGFTQGVLESASVGGFDVASTKQLLELFDSKGRKTKYVIDGTNVFKLNLRNAQKKMLASMKDGRIEPVECYERGHSRLPMTGAWGRVTQALQATSDAETLIKLLVETVAPSQRGEAQNAAIQALEVMAQDGWVAASVDKRKPLLRVNNEGARYIRAADVSEQAIKDVGEGLSYRSNL